MSDVTDQQSQGANPNVGRTRMLVLTPLFAFMVLAGIFGYQLLFGGDPQRLPSALIGKPAPQLTLEPLPGATLPDGAAIPGISPDVLQGRISIVNVFASWCGPCRVEHPQIMALGENPQLQLVGINQKDAIANANRFLTSLGNPYDVIGRDTNGRASIEWGVYGVPETFIIGTDGTILYKHVGPINPEDMTGNFGQAVQRALEGAATSG